MRGASLPLHLATALVFSPAAAIRLVTTTSLTSITPERATSFLATPANWPAVVLSSQSVEGVDGADVRAPLRPGDAVDEIFGAPPLLPLRVRWICTAAEPGRLQFASAEGLAGVASDCAMDFTVTADGQGSTVELTMSYKPRSPIAMLAAPVLALDNAVALKLLLARAMGTASAKP